MKIADLITCCFLVFAIVSFAKGFIVDGCVELILCIIVTLLSRKK